jgi:signal transduction histidine kinase
MYYYNYVVGQPKDGVLLFDSYYDALKKSENDHSLGRLNLNLGESYAEVNNTDKAMDSYKVAISYAKKTDYENLVAIGNLYLGYEQSNEGLFSSASVSLKNAFQIFEKLKDTTNMLSSKNCLAVLYSKNYFYEAAKKERDETIEIARKTKNVSILTSLYYNAAIDAKRIGDFAQQIAYLKASLKQNGYLIKRFSVKPEILVALTKAYAESDSLELAEIYFKEFVAIHKENKNDKYTEYIADAKKTLSFAKGNYKDAVKYGELYLGFQKERNKYEEVMMAEKFLSKAFGAMDNTVKRDEHLVRYYSIKDSISSVQNVKSLVYYQTLYETEKQGLKIKAQESNISLLASESEIKNQFMLFGGVSLLSVFLLIMVYKSRNTEKKEKKLQVQFSQGLLQSQEEERIRIARELHDSVGQQLTLIKIKSQNLDQEEITALTNDALEEVRSISRGLYPPLLTELGLSASITQLINEYDAQTDLFFTVDIDSVDTYFTENTMLNFYRLIQECLTNILKHAKAKAVTVSIKKEGSSIITVVSDNGKGFDVTEGKSKNSLGLKTIFERVKIMKGKLSVESQLSTGTSFIFSIPVKNEQ